MMRAPWSSSVDSDGCSYTVRDADGKYVCGPCSEAHARLIAAAPEMLALLKRHAQGLRNLVEFRLIPSSHFDATIIEAEHTERLIAKAEGKP